MLKTYIIASFIIILLSSYSCGREWEKLLKNQEIEIAPKPIITYNDSVNFDFNIKIPTEFLNEIDSIKYQILANEKSEIFLYGLIIRNEDINSDETLFIKKESIHLVQNLRKDTTEVILEIEYFKNGLSRKYLDEFQVAHIVKLNN